MMDYTTKDKCKKPKDESPNELAVAFLTNYLEDGTGLFLIRSWCDDFYVYDGGYFKLVSDKEMESEIVMFLHSNYPDEVATRHKIGNIILNIRGTRGVFISELGEANTWTGGYSPTSSSKPIVFNNGLFVDGVLEPHTPNYFTLNKVPYDYDPSATCPRWNQFLSEIMEGDADRIKLLQQWAKYILGENQKMISFLLCKGGSYNGKSVFFNLMIKLVGDSNCSAVPVSSFGNSAALYSTVGKMLNASAESCKFVEAQTEELLKNLVTEDYVMFRRLYKDAIHRRPTAKIMLATNHDIRFQDKSNGIWNRMLYVPFNKTWSKDPDNPEGYPLADKDLTDKLILELPGIFNWAMAGDLSEGFIRPKVCVDATNAYRLEINPAKAFIEESFNYDASLRPTESLGTQEAYSMYKEYCITSGYKPANISNFSKAVFSSFPRAVNQGQVLGTVFGGGQGRKHVFVGLKKADNSEIPNKSYTDDF